jgi:hypothetical protein
LTQPAALVPWVSAATSISSLLLYLAGVMELRTSAQCLLLPGLIWFAGFWLWIKRRGYSALHQRLARGCWAGLVATFVYDLVRVPMVVSGLPVFKAISYFGTVFLGEPTPTLASEVVGWTYHLSNGIGFALMYVLWMNRPSWWTAVLWGLVLEGVMLLTPYAEVFGYKISRQFLSITIGAHVVYGLGLWAGLRFLEARATLAARWPWCRHVIVVVLVGVPLGLAAIAADFHARHARAIPPSPPEYVGPHLYTTWDVLEPDRIAATWMWSRFVDKQARFHFIPSFSRLTHGQPFDVPEAEIRRTGTRSATEVLLARHRLEGDPKLALLGRMAHLYEITPWQIGTDAAPSRLGRQLKEITSPEIDLSRQQTVQRIFAWLDRWYRQPIGAEPESGWENPP